MKRINKRIIAICLTFVLTAVMLIAAPTTVFATGVGTNPPDYLSINFVEETLDGFSETSYYLVTGSLSGSRNITGVTSINIQSDISTTSPQTISVLETQSDYTAPIDGSSSPVVFTIPIRGPAVGGISATDETYFGANDGTIVHAGGDLSGFEYSTSDTTPAGSWTPIITTSVTGLSPGTYFIRLSAVADTSFARLMQGVTVEESTLDPVGLAISNIPVPSAGATASTPALTGIGFTGTFTWSPAPVGGVFQGGVAYTAQISLTVSSGYTFANVGTNGFEVDGADTVTNTAGSGSGVTALFPATIATPTITITTQPAATTNVPYRNITNETLSVAANVVPSAALTYQWYCNSSATTTSPTVIIGATSASLPLASETNLAALAKDEFLYYFCVIQSSEAADVTSSFARVNVVEPEFTSATTTITDTSAGLTLTINGAFNDFVNGNKELQTGSGCIITLNGVPLTVSNLDDTSGTLSGFPAGSTAAMGTISSGSTIITLTGAYLATLPNGTYVFVVSFGDGTTIYATPEATFVINRGGGGAGGSTDGRGTGDFTNLTGLWIAMAIAALGALYLVWRYRRQYRSQEK